MRVLIKDKPQPGLLLTEQPKPKTGANDLLIKINKTAICGTDLHIYNWDDWAQSIIKTPLIIGHEFSGEVVEVGAEVSGFAIGERVSGEGHINCGYCRNCKAGLRHLCRNHESVGVTRSGAFAEYLLLPAKNAFKLPEQISDKTASILDPLGNATHTALAFDCIGEDVLITGAGPIGIMATAIAKHIGARYVITTDISDYRLQLAKKLGATRTVNVKNESLKDVIQELGIHEGFDVGLEVSGNPQAFNSMLDTINHGGHISLLGFLPDDTTIKWNEIILKGLVIKGIYGREMYETWYKMASMLQSGLAIDNVITHEFAVNEYEQAFATLQSGQSGKVILDWQKI
ncbi:MAG: L-threonine 3-dehydrogenase [Pseudomonadota bacterium]